MPSGPEVPRPLAVAASYSWRLLVCAAALTLLGWVALQLFVVVIPVVIALFLAAALEPLAARLRRRGWPPLAAAVVVFVGSLAVLAAVVVWIGSSVADEFDQVGERVEEGVDEVEEWLTDGPLDLSEEQLDDFRARIGEAVRSGGEAGGLWQKVAGPARAALEAAGGFVLLLFTLFFLLKDGERIGRWLLDRTPDGYREDAVVVARRSRLVMRQFLLGTALTGVIDGALIAIALAVFGVPLVLPLAVLTFLGAFIPIVGATLAGAVAALVALVTNGPGDALAIVAATVVVQQVEGNVLQPLVMDRVIHLHPLVTTWVVGAGLLVGGLVGGFLAVPLTAALVQVASFYRWRDQPDRAMDVHPERP